MFARVKKSGRYQYLQIVHNERVDGRVKQRVIATLGDSIGCVKPGNSTPCSVPVPDSPSTPL